MSNESGSNIRKELLIPIIVSVVAGLILASYQFLLDGYRNKKDEPSVVDQLPTPPAQTISSPTADPTSIAAGAAIRENIEQLNRRVIDIEKMLRRHQCEEARNLIAKIRWERPDLDESRNLTSKYEKIKKGLEAQLNTCTNAESIQTAHAELEAEARQSALKSLRRFNSDIDMLSQNLELVDSKERTDGNVYKITYVYQIEALSKQEKGRRVSVQCEIPLDAEGKPSGKGSIGKTEIEEIIQ